MFLWLSKKKKTHAGTFKLKLCRQLGQYLPLQLGMGVGNEITSTPISIHSRNTNTIDSHIFLLLIIGYCMHISIEINSQSVLLLKKFPIHISWYVLTVILLRQANICCVEILIRRTRHQISDKNQFVNLKHWAIDTKEPKNCFQSLNLSFQLQL